MHRFLKLALKEVKAHKYERILQCNLAAIVVGGGSVLSIGFNRTARNSFVQYLTTFDLSGKPFINTHAEVDAMVAVLQKLSASQGHAI